MTIGGYAGLVCAECGAPIPTLKNAFCWLVLMITWPIWKPLERRFGPGMRARQFAKLQGAKGDIVPQVTWAAGLRTGLFFGVVMGAVFAAMRLLDGDPWDAAILTGLSYGLPGGIVFGVAMKIFLSIKGRGASDQAGSR